MSVFVLHLIRNAGNVEHVFCLGITIEQPTTQQWEIGFHRTGFYSIIVIMFDAGFLFATSRTQS